MAFDCERARAFCCLLYCDQRRMRPCFDHSALHARCRSSIAARWSAIERKQPKFVLARVSFRWSVFVWVIDFSLCDRDSQLITAFHLRFQFASVAATGARSPLHLIKSARSALARRRLSTTAECAPRSNARASERARARTRLRLSSIGGGGRARARSNGGARKFQRRSSRS